MLRKLTKLFTTNSYFYKILLICFIPLFLSKNLSTPYIAIALVVLTYIICNNLKIQLNTDINFLELFKYLIFLFKEIAIASFFVARIIWSKDLKISPKIASVKTRNKSDLGVTILTHSITLTPGTITVSVDEDTILVHALEENSIQDIEKGEMDLRIKNICI